jgi:hypothetical protein
MIGEVNLLPSSSGKISDFELVEAVEGEELAACG